MPTNSAVTYCIIVNIFSLLSCSASNGRSASHQTFAQKAASVTGHIAASSASSEAAG